MIKNVKHYLKRKQKKQQEKALYRKTRQQNKTRYYTSEQILSNCSLAVLNLLSEYKNHRVPFYQIKQNVRKKQTGLTVSDPIKKTKTFIPYQLFYNSAYGSLKG